MLLDPLGCDLARKCEIIIRTDCLEVEGNKQTSNTFLKEKRSLLKILGSKLYYRKQKIQAYATFRASYSSHLESSDGSFLFLNCAQSLVLGEEEVCSFTVAAGKVSASVLPGISGFLSSFLGARLVS